MLSEGKHLLCLPFFGAWVIDQNVGFDRFHLLVLSYLFCGSESSHKIDPAFMNEAAVTVAWFWHVFFYFLPLNASDGLAVSPFCLR